MLEQQITPALIHLARAASADVDICWSVPRALVHSFAGRVTHHVYDEVVAALEAEGWELLGGGAYSVALTHPVMEGKVLKVCLLDDDTSTLWWDFCAQNQGRPYVPVQYLHGKILGLPFVIMDRLELDQDRAVYFTQGYADEWDDDYAELVAEAEGLGHLDLHDENIMFHPVYGTPFLTDPIM